MDELVWQGLEEHSTTGMEDDDAAFNSTAATSTAWSSAGQQQQSVPAKVTATMGLVILGTGMLTNSGVLAVLVRARRQFLDVLAKRSLLGWE